MSLSSRRAASAKNSSSLSTQSWMPSLISSSVALMLTAQTPHSLIVRLDGNSKNENIRKMIAESNDRHFEPILMKRLKKVCQKRKIGFCHTAKAMTTCWQLIFRYIQNYTTVPNWNWTDIMKKAMNLCSIRRLLLNSRPN